MRKNIHDQHRNYLALLTEFLLRRSLDEQTWEARHARQLEVLERKERIWSREPGELAAWLRPYLGHIELQLAMTDPALQQMKGYLTDEERAEYTRLVTYRSKLLDEKQRVEAALATTCQHAANEDTDLQLAS